MQSIPNAPTSRFFFVALMIVLWSLATPAQDKSTRSGKVSSRGPGGGTMSFARLPEDPSQYNLVLSDGEETVVTGTFDMEQLQLIRAIMSEARKFALSEEGASKEEATTTRFSDPEIESLYVDVEKFGSQSSLFVTLNTDNGQMTVEGGISSIADKTEKGPFFDILTRLNAALGKPRAPGQ
jgi:hypothetical protein